MAGLDGVQLGDADRYTVGAGKFDPFQTRTPFGYLLFPTEGPASIRNPRGLRLLQGDTDLLQNVIVGPRSGHVFA